MNVQLDKKQVAEIIDEIGTLLELKGENPFKSRAYHTAARAIAALTEDFEALVERQELHTIRGIGKSIAEKITELATTGKLPYYDQLKASLPPGLLDMLKIQGLGPKRVILLYKKLKIKSIEELQKACETHRLAKIKGFGDKTEQNILKGIQRLRTTSQKHLYPKAREAAERIRSTLASINGVQECEVAGSLRRKKEVIGDIDIVLSSTERAREVIIERFTSHPDVETVLAKGETKASVILKSGIHCDIRIVTASEYPFALNYFTGSKEHNVEIRSIARKFGWSLNEYGFSYIEGEAKKEISRIPRCKSEADVYRALGLAYIPPELRENMGEIEAARKGELPTLIEEKDLRGTFHCHTTYSDGANTIEEMAKGAIKRGWSYWGVADHSQTAAYAGGMDIAKIKAQHKEIDELNRHVKNFRIFKGTECDILPDGSLDYPDSVLARFEYVVAAIHSKLNMTEQEATRRLVKALKNKHVTMLAHPTGRILLSRDGYPVNMLEVINAAADYGKAIEINAHPFRLDLDWKFVKYAKSKGVPIVINPDAHNVDGLNDVQYGVGVARKGWLEARDVLNTWDVSEIERFFRIHGS